MADTDDFNPDTCHACCRQQDPAKIFIKEIVLDTIIAILWSTLYSTGVLYGQGVHFTVNSADAASCAQPDTKGLCRMYYARVLAGEYTKGDLQMTIPPSKNDPSNPSLPYDTTVDKVDDPGVFVIYYDTQAYPEYIVTFK